MFKRDREKALTSRLTATLAVKLEKDRWVVKIAEQREQDFRAVILHHIVNCNKYWNPSKMSAAQAAQNTAFWDRMPLLREDESAEIVSMISQEAFKAVETFVKRQVNKICDADKKLGYFTQGEDFQTIDSEFRKGDAAWRTTEVAQRQVNHLKFDGIIRLDGHLFREDVLQASVSATARENDWQDVEWEDWMEFVRTTYDDFQATGQHKDINIDSLMKDKA